MSRKGKEKKIIIGGRLYTFRHPGVREGMQIRKRAKDRFGNLIKDRYAEELMKHVIIYPQTDWSYWEGNKWFSLVMREASDFLVGNK